MKKLLKLFRKKTYCIVVIRSFDDLMGLEISVNEWIKDHNVKPINVSFSFQSFTNQQTGGPSTIREACILYKF